MSTLKVDTILKRSGTGTITLGQSGDTLSIPSGATIANSGTATGFAPVGISSSMTSGTGLSIDANGHVTKPLQSAFLVTKSSTMDNQGTSEFDVTWQTEVFDRNGDFALNEFTAPVTGIYEMNVQIEGVQLDADASNAYTQLRLQASNRSFYHVFRNDKELSADASVDLQLSALVDMDANDTCKVTMHFANGHSTSDIGTSYTWWSGVLIA
jgi:hypothetical protein